MPKRNANFINKSTLKEYSNVNILTPEDIDNILAPGVLFKFNDDKSNNIYKIGHIKKIRNDFENLYAVGINSIYNNQYIHHTNIDLLKLLLSRHIIEIIHPSQLEGNKFNKNIFFNATKEIQKINANTETNKKKCTFCINRNKCLSYTKLESNNCDNLFIDDALTIQFNNNICNDDIFYVKIADDSSNDIFTIVRNIKSSPFKVTWDIKLDSTKTLCWNLSKDELEQILTNNNFIFTKKQDYLAVTKPVININKLKLFNSLIKSKLNITNKKVNFTNLIFFKFNNCNSAVFAYDKITLEFYQIYPYSITPLGSLSTQNINYINQELDILNVEQLTNFELGSSCSCFTHNLTEARIYTELDLTNKVFFNLSYKSNTGTEVYLLKLTSQCSDVCIHGEWKSKTSRYFLDKNNKKHAYISIESVYNYLKNNDYSPYPLTDKWCKYDSIYPNKINDNLNVLECLLKNINCDPFTDIYYIDNYHKYWIYNDYQKTKNPKFSKKTGGYILDVKNGHASGINYYSKKLITILSQINICEPWITIVPSSKKDTLNDGMCNLIFDVVDT